MECLFPDSDSIIHALKLLQCQLLRYASNNSKMNVGWRTEHQIENILAVVHGHKIVQAINLTVTNHMYVRTYTAQFELMCECILDEDGASAIKRHLAMYTVDIDSLITAKANLLSR